MHVQFMSTWLNEGATDRLGMFRLRDLPHGKLRIDLRRCQEQEGWARIPAEAVEVDLILPWRPFVGGIAEIGERFGNATRERFGNATRGGSPNFAFRSSSLISVIGLTITVSPP
jgi:hypothetical protein